MEQSSITLRQATLSDLDELVSISRQTFHDAFAAMNDPEDFDAYVSAAFDKEKMRLELSNYSSQFWIVLYENNIIGYLKVNFSPAQSDIREKDSLEIERIYVTEKHQGNNIGRLLMNRAKIIAENAGLSNIWLGVWEKNTRAIKFYERIGFHKFGAHTFMIGTDPQTDVLMRWVLEER